FSIGSPIFLIFSILPLRHVYFNMMFLMRFSAGVLQISGVKSSLCFEKNIFFEDIRSFFLLQKFFTLKNSRKTQLLCF
ncbi:hypothetical protein, partial [Treponema sp.]|uniref:hypothetical protein n=1 Tax=Treponema sp. TaxID=166 RepID=UPI00298DFC43